MNILLRIIILAGITGIMGGITAAIRSLPQPAPVDNAYPAPAMGPAVQTTAVPYPAPEGYPVPPASWPTATALQTPTSPPMWTPEVTPTIGCPPDVNGCGP